MTVLKYLKESNYNITRIGMGQFLNIPALLIVFLSVAFSGGEFNKSGRTAMQVTKIGIGAHQVAMGEACVASIRDINSLYWNPAGIGGIGRAQASANYTNWFSDLEYLSAAAGFSIKNRHYFAISAASLNYGDLEEATIPVTGGSSDTRTGEMFSGSDLILGFTYARQFTDKLTIGFMWKFLSETLYTYEQNMSVFDIGTFYNTGFKGIRIGMSAQNFTVSTVKFLGNNGDRIEGYDIPLIYRVGAGLDIINKSDGLIGTSNLHYLQASFDAINTNDYGERYHFGLEYRFHDLISLRGGYRFNYEEGNLSAGVGILTRKFKIDYSFTEYEYLESPQRISLIYAF